MASLKEIKRRITSIQSTQKITAAMKMVSSAKFHRAQLSTTNTLAYAERMSKIMDGLLSDDKTRVKSSYTEQREVKTVAFVVFSSSSGLCGAFNANIAKEFFAVLDQYRKEEIKVRIFPVGKKIAQELKNAACENVDERFMLAGDKFTYESAVDIADFLMQLYVDKEVDSVEFMYHHFRNMMSQVVTRKTYLPLIVKQKERDNVLSENEEWIQTDYIIEPSAAELQAYLYPKLLHLNMYTTLLDTNTSEHAARMSAMQTANDNANDLIQELTLQYNKTRQQAITNELLDIMGGLG